MRWFAILAIADLPVPMLGSLKRRPIQNPYLDQTAVFVVHEHHHNALTVSSPN